MEELLSSASIMTGYTRERNKTEDDGLWCCHEVVSISDEDHCHAQPVRARKHLTFSVQER
eukprot:scaffold4298_cov55-Cylindrotheca_fusiformis.AAC.2